MNKKGQGEVLSKMFWIGAFFFFAWVIIMLFIGFPGMKAEDICKERGLKWTENSDYKADWINPFKYELTEVTCEKIVPNPNLVVIDLVVIDLEEEKLMKKLAPITLFNMSQLRNDFQLYIEDPDLITDFECNDNYNKAIFNKCLYIIKDRDYYIILETNMTTLISGFIDLTSNFTDKDLEKINLTRKQLDEIIINITKELGLPYDKR